MEPFCLLKARLHTYNNSSSSCHLNSTKPIDSLTMEPKSTSSWVYNMYIYRTKDISALHSKSIHLHQTDQTTACCGVQGAGPQDAHR